MVSLRSSVAHRLALADEPDADRSVDGLVQVMQDALANHSAALDLERLCRWQSALFPGGTSGITRIAVGRVRDHADAMQIVSGALGREVVHCEAPPSAQVAAEMDRFLAWFASTRPAGTATVMATASASAHASASAPSSNPTAPVNGIARAALVHLWFESIHPFEDGNGRLGRALADMALAQDMHAHDPDASPVLVRVYGLAHQMLKTRAAYCDALNHTQRLTHMAPDATTLDATPWVQWFVQAFARACMDSQAVVRDATDKAQFWQQAAQCHVNPRQSKVLKRLLDADHVGSGGGCLGGMTSEKYAKITATSKATATRDLADLLAHGLLRVEGVGKATRHAVNVPGWVQPALKA